MLPLKLVIGYSDKTPTYIGRQMPCLHIHCRFQRLEYYTSLSPGRGSGITGDTP